MRKQSIKKRWRAWADERHNSKELLKVTCEGDANPVIRGRIQVYESETARNFLHLAKGVVINSSEWANPVGGLHTKFIFLKADARISLGEKTAISNVTIAAASRIELGANIFVGAGTKIFDTDFHSLHVEHRLNKNLGIVVKPIAIEDNAFIGAETTILKGVRIGAGAVIGASSVVTKDIPAGEIWAGNPAKFIKKVPACEDIDVDKYIL